MAYPDYSVVIISVTENGVTNDYAQSFFNDELAKKYYTQAVSEGKRAFYYEKPRPTRFVRNDSQPLRANTEKGLENQPIESIEGGEEQEIGEVAEEVLVNAQTNFLDAVKTLRTITKLQILVAKKWYDLYTGPFNFIIKKFRGIINEPVGVIGSEVISNKRITWRHDGSGGVNFTIEKIWPDKDDISWNPPLDTNPIRVITAIEGVDVDLGTKRFKWVHDGTPTGGPVTEEYTWIPAGTVIYSSTTTDLEYLSDGNGAYTSRNKNTTNCDPLGFVYSQLSQNDIMYNLQNAGGPDLQVKIGDIFVEMVADGDCGEQEASRTLYFTAGVTVHEDDTYAYQTNGTGGVVQRPRMITEPVNYQSPCGPMQVGTRERYYDGTGTDNTYYYSYGTEVGRCNGLIYFSLANGEVFTEEEPPPPPPPPPPEDQWFYDPSTGFNWDDDESGKNFTVSFEYELTLFNGFGVEYDAYYDFSLGLWVQNADQTMA